ncbi:MAG TPA: hypothetical protein VF484_05130 [Candidatus Limnocylindrales bacterium]
MNHFIEKVVSVPSACMSSMIFETAATKSVGSGPLLSHDAASCSMKTGSPTLTIGVAFSIALSMTVAELRKPSPTFWPAAMSWAQVWSVSTAFTVTPAGGVATVPSDSLWSVPLSQSSYVVAVPTQTILPASPSRVVMPDFVVAAIWAGV